MATKDPIRKFAEQVLLVERVLDKLSVNGNAGRVAFILEAASRAGGVTQKHVVEGAALPKDVVSKLVGSLVKAGLLTQEREGKNSRFKRLGTTALGKQLLSQVRAALQPPGPARQEPARKPETLSFF